MGVRLSDRRVLLTALAAVAAMGLAATVEERLDLSALPEADVFVRVSFSPGEELPRTVEELRQPLCRRTVDSPISGCYGTLDAANRKAFFQVRLEDVSPAIRGLARVGGRLAVSLAYDPLFSRLPLSVERWSMRVTMPDRQRLSFAGAKATRLDIQYAFRQLGALPTGVELRDGSVELGRVVAASTLLPADRPPVLLCLYTLSNATDVLAQRAVKGCVPSYFGTSDGWAPGLYKVSSMAVAFFLDGVTVGEAEALVALERLAVAGAAPAPVSVTVPQKAGDIWFAGEPVVATLSSPDPEARCSLHLADVRARVTVKRAIPCSGEARLVTFDLPQGDYILEVREEATGRSVFSRLVRILPASSTAEPESSLERSDYLAGETVIASVGLPGMECSGELVGSEGYVVALGERGPCERVLLDTPSTLRAGRYTLRIKAFEGDVVVATVRSAVVVSSPRVADESDRARYCTGGVFAFKGGRLRCTGEGERCEPTSVQLPGCLCFSGEGAFVGVCTHTQRCASSGCEELGGRPYIVARDASSCMVKKGLESYPCIGFGEACSGFCACTDGPEVLDTCYFGEACTPDGCSAPELVLKVRSFEPAHVRADRLTATPLDLTVTAAYKGNTLSDRPSFNLTVGGEPAAVAGVEEVADGAWRVSGRTALSLAPGRYPVLLTARSGGAVYSVRAELEVWHPQWMSALTVDLLRAPAALAADRLVAGERIDMDFRLFDAAGAEVTDLPAGDFNASLGWRVLNLDSLSYDRARGRWRATLLGQGEFEPGTSMLGLRVSHLGMEGIAERPVAIVDKLPARIRIREVSPKQVFQAQTVWGFDLSLELALQGDIADRSVCATVHGKRYDALLTPYQDSFVASVVGVRLCPDIVTGGEEAVTVTGTTGDGTEVSASDAVVVVPNPGGWVNDRCEGGP